MKLPQYADVFERLTAWWQGRDIGRAVVDAFLPAEHADLPESLNVHWPTPQCEPDLDALVADQLRCAEARMPVGEHLPFLTHTYGGRGTPMNLAWYFGGPIRFTDHSVYVEPCIEDWERFEVRFDPEHPWVRRSDALMHAQGRAAADRALAWLPDLGDALTVFSLLRGTERLLMDLIEIPDVIQRKTIEFTTAFIDAHRHFHDLYSRYWPGDANACSVWTPGKTYLNQCDFSTMISPEMFRQFVVPELQAYAGYLDYVFWHLDGYEEVRHLPALLEQQDLRAVQIQPGANNPPAASATWLPVCKAVQEAGKGVYACAHSPEEFATLTRELDCSKLWIACAYPLEDRADADRHLKLAEGPSA